MMANPDQAVYALSVSDRFGEAGLTGVLVMNWAGEEAQVHAFFMSCRVIGRGIESAVWNVILEDARRAGCSTLVADYIPTQKNAQVATFFQELGLDLVDTATDGSRHYRIALPAFLPPPTPWIEVIDAR
jgi:FkbH-like protein